MRTRKPSSADERAASIRMSIEALMSTFDANQGAEAVMVLHRYGARDVDSVVDEDLSEVYGEMHEIQMNYS